MRWYAVEKWLVVAVALLMVAIGCAAILWPAPALQQLGIEAPSPALLYLQSINGLLLAVPGALLLHAIASRQALRLILQWVILEKAAYVALSAVALHQGAGTQTLPAAIVFDTAACLLLIDFRRRHSARR